MTKTLKTGRPSTQFAKQFKDCEFPTWTLKEATQVVSRDQAQAYLDAHGKTMRCSGGIEDALQNAALGAEPQYALREVVTIAGHRVQIEGVSLIVTTPKGVTFSTTVDKTRTRAFYRMIARLDLGARSVLRELIDELKNVNHFRRIRSTEIYETEQLVDMQGADGAVYERQSLHRQFWNNPETRPALVFKVAISRLKYALEVIKNRGNALAGLVENVEASTRGVFWSSALWYNTDWSAELLLGQSLPQLAHIPAPQRWDYVSKGSVRESNVRRKYSRGFGKNVQRCLNFIPDRNKRRASRKLKLMLQVMSREDLELIFRDVTGDTTDLQGNPYRVEDMLECDAKDMLTAKLLQETRGPQIGSWMVLRDAASMAETLIQEGRNLFLLTPEQFKLPKGTGSILAVRDLEQRIVDARQKDQTLFDKFFTEECEKLGIATYDPNEERLLARHQLPEGEFRCPETGEDFLIQIAHSSGILKEESAKLKHCVEGNHYVTRASEGKIALVLFRIIVDGEIQPAFTVEVRNGEIVQARGKYNRPVTSSEGLTLARWAKLAQVKYQPSKEHLAEWGDKTKGDVSALLIPRPEHSFDHRQAALKAMIEREGHNGALRETAMQKADQRLKAELAIDEEESHRRAGQMTITLRKLVQDMNEMLKRILEGCFSKVPFAMTVPSIFGDLRTGAPGAPEVSALPNRGAMTLYDTPYGAKVSIISSRGMFIYHAEIAHLGFRTERFIMHEGGLIHKAEMDSRGSRWRYVTPLTSIRSIGYISANLYNAFTGIHRGKCGELMHDSLSGISVKGITGLDLKIPLRPRKLPRSKRARLALAQAWEARKAELGLTVTEGGVLVLQGQELSLNWKQFEVAQMLGKVIELPKEQQSLRNRNMNNLYVIVERTIEQIRSDGEDINDRKVAEAMVPKALKPWLTWSEITLELLDTVMQANHANQKTDYPSLRKTIDINAHLPTNLVKAQATQGNAARHEHGTGQIQRGYAAVQRGAVA